MQRLRTWGRVLLAAGAVVFLTTGLALAAAKTPETPPDPKDNPMLAKLMETGARVFFMGTRDGLNGWFIAKDNQVQMAYTTADNQSTIMGVLFDQLGDNLSATQFQTLIDTNKDVATYIAGLNLQSAGATAKGITPPAVLAPLAAAGASPSPGEKLVLALQGAAGVTVGAASAAQLFMVIDPNCPHCQATWRELRDAVFKNNLQIRLIPIGSPGSDDQRAAARLLQADNALDAWDKYVGGDKSQLAGPPDQTKLDAITANDNLMDAWHIQYTPYLVYRAKDGTVKVLQGEPEHIAAVLGELTR